MDIHFQQAFSHIVLDNLKILDPEAAIAGGAARDWYFDRVARDIDIYLSYHPNLPHGVIIKSISKALGVPTDSIRVLGADELLGSGYSANNGIVGVYEVMISGIIFQIINMRCSGIEKQVNNFCLSICQAWDTGNGRIYTTPDFKISVSRKIVFRTGNLSFNKEEYFFKIKKKFPDYEFLGM